MGHSGKQIMRLISLLALSALLIGVTGSPGCGVEHENVAFDVAPDGKRIVFSAADGDLYLFRMARASCSWREPSGTMPGERSIASGELTSMGRTPGASPAASYSPIHSDGSQRRDKQPSLT